MSAGPQAGELRACATAAEVVDSLPVLDEAAVAAARVAVDERPIDYRLGSAEAEEVALLSGLKPVVRQFLAEGPLAAAAARFAERGLFVEQARSTFLDPPFAGRVLYAGRDAERVRATVAADARSGEERQLGRLLGYPRCCVERYLALEPPRRNADLLRGALLATRGRAEPRLNVADLGVFHYLSWVPCAFDCAPSLAYASQVAWQIAFRHGQALQHPEAPRAVCPPGCEHQRFVVRIDRALAAHRLFLLDEVQLSIAGRFLGPQGGPPGGTLTIERVWPTARDRHPDALIPVNGEGASAREAVARLWVLLGAARSVEVRGDTLLVDEAPRLRSRDLLLLPFGEAGRRARDDRAPPIDALP